MPDPVASRERQPAADHDLDDHPGDPVVTETWLDAPARSYQRRPATIVDILDRAVRRWPDVVAFGPLRNGVTYRIFAGHVETAATSLLRRGLKPGDAVAVAAANTLDLAVLLFACARAHLVMVGLNTRLAPKQWAYMVEHSRAALLLSADGFDLAAADPLADVLREAPAQPWSYAPADRPDPEAPYAVVFTSGTTGRPKAAQVVHRCSVHSAMSYQRILQLQRSETTAVLFPLYYISAMHAHVLPAMLVGARCVLIDTSSPRDYVAVLRQEQVNWAYAVPSWWRLCLRLPEFTDLPQLTRLAAGGAPLPSDLVAGLRERLPHVRLHDVYGLSETHSPGCIATDADLSSHPGSVGRPVDCMEAQIRDEEGTVLDTDQPGRLWLRGSLVTTGYLHDPAASAAAIVNGWFDTGDIARIDADGYVTVLDRAKDMINRGGTKIFSAEVEELLRRHPAIADAAVVAMPDPLGSEAVAAFVVAQGPVTTGDVRAWVRNEMADYAAPKVVHFIDALPRNSVGKTDKAALRARLAG